MIRKSTVRILLAILCAGFTSVHAEVKENKTQAEVKLSENRLNKKLGAYLGILGDPHPTVIGVNVAYNVNEYLRASLGFGKISASTIDLNDPTGFTDTSMTTIGAAAKFLMPGWNFSPSASLGYSHVFFDGMLADADYKSNNIYLGLGGDWQAESGFNLGAGLNVSINGGAPTAPYINVGMFF